MNTTAIAMTPKRSWTISTLDARQVKVKAEKNKRGLAETILGDLSKRGGSRAPALARSASIAEAYRSTSLDPGHRLACCRPTGGRRYILAGPATSARYGDGMKPPISWRTALFTRIQPGERVRSYVMTFCASVGAFVLLAALRSAHAAFLVPSGSILLLAAIVEVLAIAQGRRHGGIGNAQRDPRTDNPG
jgi:hypothetical protein